MVLECKITASLGTSPKPRGRRLRSARTWQQHHIELDSWKTSRLRALNAVERVVRLGNSPR